MRNIKLTIEYDGSQFNGWQIQESSQRTVQGEVEKILQRIFKTKIHLHGSGRTDSGVHALGQVAHFKVDTAKTVSEIQSAINANLPRDIAIIDAQEMNEDFHAQFSAQEKTYRYTILNRAIRSPQYRNSTFYVPYSLNLAQMRKAAKILIGKKDFQIFTSLESARIRSGKSRGTIRTIKKLKITKRGELIFLDITADGFLYRMVRNITGALLEVGQGRLPLTDLKRALTHTIKLNAFKAAPAWGLTLWEVKYPPKYSKKKRLTRKR